VGFGVDNFEPVCS